MNFTIQQIKQIEDKGLTVDKVLKQIEIFKTGLPYINLESAASLEHGINKLTEAEENYYLNFYKEKKESLDIVKFVPASGAATRMFKFLFEFLSTYKKDKQTINSFINKNKATELSLFGVGLEKFPFYKIVLSEAEKYVTDFKSLSADEKGLEFIKTMLDENRLNYGFSPKGLLPFHKYKDHIATAFEEHLFEAALYVKSKGVAKLHFTISEIYKDIFDEEFLRIQKIVERKTDTKFEISFSYQKSATDTIAVNLKNEPFVEADGSLYFRPSGHGALLSNLNDFEADIIFIKNIDNVVVYKYEKDVAKYKKILAGILIKTQSTAFQYLKELEEDNITEAKIIEIARFLRSKMNVIISLEFEKYSTKYQKEYLIDKLNRPIRVCGMVKNEGEPGGGPFWVKDQANNISLQIVESAQIDKKNKHQKSILKRATHFNPVDLVCGIRDYKGETFDLSQFVDEKTAFITMKTKTGKEIKALELPGLWNGSMANWNTIFVEVPLVTFNPVKTVNDLLKPMHQIS
ncbi:DUF4301 family protein [Lacinutrix sp. MedPE-SW]|uniref:DUF4301 family protein n=1 Tax=Lacinutrix sp. MedPE-SW TaxID=1860087 RepID=UPI00090F5640|nr:DUF4301 family protein [Lacinutrix sp. MedPE-SW]OIQ20256.1 MAG: NAD metabolism ATPase/kinase [Lacinutrix sp. MedPE-SW]